MSCYKTRRYQQLVYRTTPDSLVDWLDGELAKRGIDAAYTHCILSILQDGSQEPDDCIDNTNGQKVYRKLEGLFSAGKSKTQKLKSYSKQILLSSSIPYPNVDNANSEQKKKCAAINCLKSVSDDNSIEDLIDELCVRLKNIRNLSAPEKGESENVDKCDKDYPFYIPPSSPTDQVKRYFAAFPPLDRIKEERTDSSQVTRLNNCYANCITQSKTIVQDSFISSSSFQNFENSKNKNIYQSGNNNKTLKIRSSQPSEYNTNKSSVTMLHSDRNSDTNVQNSCEKSGNKIYRKKDVSRKPKKNLTNKPNYLSEKEPDWKKKSLINVKTDCNSKKVKNSNEPYFSSNKFFVLMEVDPEEHNVNFPVSPPLELQKKMKAVEIIPDPCKKFKASKTAYSLEDTFNDSSSDKNVADSTVLELPLPCSTKKYCDKEHICKNDTCSKNSSTLEMHAEKRKSYFKNNVFEEINDMSPCKVPRYTDKDCYSEDVIKEDSSDVNYLDLNLCIIKDLPSELDSLYASKENGSRISCQMKMRKSTCAKQSICCVLDVDVLKEDPMILSEENQIEPSQSSEKKALAITKQISANNINDNSLQSLYIDFGSKKVHQQNFTFALAIMNVITIENNTYYQFNACKALDYFSPREIFNIMTTGNNNEVNNFLNKFSIQTNSNSKALPDENIVSETFPATGFKVSACFPKKQHSNLYLQSNFACKEKCEDETLCDKACSEESLFSCTQPKMVERAQDTPTIFGQWNYNLFFDLCHENPLVSKYSTKFDNLSTKASVDDSNKEIDFMFPKKKLSNENHCNVCPSEQFINVENKNSIWNVSNRNSCNNYSTLSTSGLCRNNFSETHSSSVPNCSENKFNYEQYEQNTEDSAHVNSTMSFSSYSAFRNMQKKGHSSKSCSQNLLKKAVNIDRVIHRINAKHRVDSLLNALQVKPLAREIIEDDDGCITMTDHCLPKVYTEIVADGAFGPIGPKIPDPLIYTDSMTVPFDTEDEVSGYVNLNFSKKCQNSDESLRAIWENNSSPLNVNKNNYKPVVTESGYAFDNFDLQSMQKDLEREEEELLKTTYSFSDSKDDINNDVTSNSKFQNSCFLETNDRNESQKLNVEQFPGISVPMHDDTTAKSTSKFLDYSKDSSVPVNMFNIDRCATIIDTQRTFSDTDYLYAYQDCNFIDASAFIDQYDNYSENKTKYFDDASWNWESDKFMFESDACHYQSSSLHEQEIPGDEMISGTENDYCKHEQGLYDAETAQLNKNRLHIVNANRHMKYKHFTSARKPCTFFVEGTCCKPNCKFSHDLSKITCKFWKEGSCFKGNTCPFLHGYIERPKVNHRNDESESKNCYSLDSETDFPSLSAAACKKTRSKSSPVDIGTSKRL